jgi:fatty acid desaturase
MSANVEAPMTTEPPLKKLHSLRNELKRRGWYQKKPGRILLELAYHLTLSLGGIAVFVMADSWILRICGILVSTVGSMSVGTNTHTASHHGTSTKKWVNDALTYFGYPVFLGLSATYWRYMHVIRHHPAPNVIGMDMDHDLTPWFCLVRPQIEETSGLRRFYYEHLQFFVFPFALAFNGFNFQRAGLRYLYSSLGDPKTRPKTPYVIDVASMLVHYFIWIIVPMAFFPATSVLLFYALRLALLGYAMFAVLAPGHFPDEAIVIEKTELGEENFILRQTATSINFRTGFIGRLVCSGLEYQIEHHLFPNLSHVHYPQVSEVVKEFCRENGYPHRTLGWGEAIWKSYKVLRAPKDVYPTLPQLS